MCLQGWKKTPTAGVPKVDTTNILSFAAVLLQDGGIISQRIEVSSMGFALT